MCVFVCACVRVCRNLAPFPLAPHVSCIPFLRYLSLACAVRGQASEVEETLKRIRSHRGVEGILIVNNDGIALKSTLSAELTTQYAGDSTALRSVL
jgi:hypothetical protein